MLRRERWGEQKETCSTWLSTLDALPYPKRSEKDCDTQSKDAGDLGTLLLAQFGVLCVEQTNDLDCGRELDKSICHLMEHGVAEVDLWKRGTTRVSAKPTLSHARAHAHMRP